ncbi:TRAP transporter small permease [Hoeflea sp. TYP-13]|uniref:TRAP transporter small permease n=1 Tax=Hoeflea sp. TYP-13 TaxID=3230023 RepID=UPI0034C666C1
MLALPSAIQSLARFVDMLNRIARSACNRLLELIVAVTFMQVVLRYIFNSPTKWSEEAAMLCLVWYGMLATAICVRDHHHIAIVFFRDLLGKTGGYVLDVFAHLIILCFALVLLFSGSKLVDLAGVALLPASGIPKYLLYYSAFTGGALIVLNAITNIVTGSLRPDEFAEPETTS